ncbi:hypothetical protein NHF48_022095 [Sphingomonas sp. H160509]|uniref:hypothetical protein n=1 Tax=Sphingomonas sp. H160509 TaxID=2955313 RepID=UPI002096E29B|nr:hypothetical protein [Sphingomonas sp. H160509]MDD1452997.1 hypothetical protein [Sphingomonas sp. H160509]
MGFANNSTLFTSGNRVDVDNNGTNDSYDLAEGRANQIVIGANNTGNDVFLNFGSRSTLISHTKLFEGFETFGSNITIDLDRYNEISSRGKSAALPDLASSELRFLGSKTGDDMFVYADAATVRQLSTMFSSAKIVDSKVSNEKFNAAKGSYVFLFDTALGLNLGGDTISHFGADDRLVTTSEIYNGQDADPSDRINFGKNKLLDLSGELPSSVGDVGAGHGGQVSLPGIGGLYLLATEIGSNGAEYYIYGSSPHVS